jgi:hypothetical protein
MNYSVDHLYDENIICINVIGRMNFHGAAKYSKEAIILARKNNCNKFIFDHRYTTFHGSVSNFHTSEDELQQFGFKNTDQIAIVVQKQKKNSNLQIAPIRNNSWSILKYFSNGDKTEAISWLAQSDKVE